MSKSVKHKQLIYDPQNMQHHKSQQPLLVPLNQLPKEDLVSFQESNIYEKGLTGIEGNKTDLTTQAFGPQQPDVLVDEKPSGEPTENTIVQVPEHASDVSGLEDSVVKVPPILAKKTNQSSRRTPKASDVSIVQKHKLEEAYRPRLSQKRMVSTIFDHKAIRAFDGVRQSKRHTNSPRDETALNQQIKRRSMNYTRIFKMDTFARPGPVQDVISPVVGSRHDSQAIIQNESLQLATDEAAFVQKQRPKTRENTRNNTLMTMQPGRRDQRNLHQKGKSQAFVISQVDTDSSMMSVKGDAFLKFPAYKPPQSFFSKRKHRGNITPKKKVTFANKILKQSTQIAEDHTMGSQGESPHEQIRQNHRMQTMDSEFFNQNQSMQKRPQTGPECGSAQRRKMITVNVSKLMRRESPDQMVSPKTKYSLKEAIKIISGERHVKNSATSTSRAKFTTANTALQPTLDNTSEFEVQADPEPTQRNKTAPISPVASSKHKLAAFQQRPEENDLTSSIGRMQLYAMQKRSVVHKIDTIKPEKCELLHKALKQLLKIQQFENTRAIKTKLQQSQSPECPERQIADRKEISTQQDLQSQNELAQIDEQPENPPPQMLAEDDLMTELQTKRKLYVKHSKNLNDRQKTLTQELYVDDENKKLVMNTKKILSVALRLVSKLKGYHLKLMDEKAKGQSTTQIYMENLQKSSQQQAAYRQFKLIQKQRIQSTGPTSFDYDLSKIKEHEKEKFLQDLIGKMENALRERTDEVLRDGPAFDLVLESQRSFAVYQDNNAQKTRKLRSEIAFQNIKELNELVQKRKTLQIEAYRLTQRFKIYVNQMAQKDVEDIFSKVMHKDKFKKATTVGLVRSFLTQIGRKNDVKKQPTKITEQPETIGSEKDKYSQEY